MPDWTAVRGFLIGLVLLPVVAIAVLSVRPGGLRRQLRLVRRRFKIAMLLAGVYLAASTVVRIAFPASHPAEYALLALAVLEAAVFVLTTQDPSPGPG